MKKILATFLVVCFMIISSSNVYALNPADAAITNQYGFFTSEVYDISEVSFKEIDEYLENFAKEYFMETGEKITWAICSLSNHRKLKFYVFFDKKVEAYQELINAIDVDFIQFETLQDKELLDDTKEAFEEDSVKAALDTVLPIDNDLKPYEDLSHLPVYWCIKEEINMDTYILEVAIGKYVINRGDSLSKIAWKNHTTVERLLELNSNIIDPNMIYHGEYLVVK